MPQNERYLCEHFWPLSHNCQYKSQPKCNGDIRRCPLNLKHNEAMTNFINNIEQTNININRSSLIKKLREVNEQNDEKIPDWVWFVINSMESVKDGNTKKKHTTKQ